jgi:chemotaxis protein CheX
VSVLAADIETITRDIWRALLDLPFESGGTPAAGAGLVTGLVHVQGGWNGAVMLQCPRPLATALAAAMFRGGDEPDEEEVRDALGELTNMVAGNVKALLPPPCSISLPTVALGSDYEVSVVGTLPDVAVTFTSGTHPLTVTLLGAAPAPEAGEP